MSTALSVVEPQAPEVMGGFALARYITEQAGPIAKLAQLYVNGGLVPSAILRSQNPVGAAFTVLTTGMELGLPPATALRVIHVIEGRASLSADLMAGLAMQSGVALEYLQNDNVGCKIRWTRGESTGIVAFTIDDARTAGLLGKDNWKKYPAAMLSARATARAARQAAPDRLAGCYTPDEIMPGGGGGYDPDLPTPTPNAGGTSTPSPATGAAAEVPGLHTGSPAAVASPSPKAGRPAPAPALTDPIQNSTRSHLMGLATRCGCKGEADVPQANGAVRKSTTIVLDEALAQAIGKPGVEYVPVIELTEAMGRALIEEMEIRQRDEDAGAALGEEAS